MHNAIMKASFTFGHELYTGAASRSIVNKSCYYCCTPHLRLLKAFPSIRVAQNVIDIILERFPVLLSVGCAFNYECLDALKKVSEEVGENVCDKLVWRKWGDRFCYI